MKKYRLVYDRHLLSNDNIIEYKGERLAGLAVSFSVAVTKDGTEQYFTVGDNEEPREQHFAFDEKDAMYSRSPSSAFLFFVDAKSENGYRTELTDTAKMSGYDFKIEPVAATKWVNSGANPVEITCDEFVDILKNNIEQFDRSDNKPAQNCCYSWILA